MSYKTKLKSIKNFVFDVDGVFTDGSITVDINGNELRQFSTREDRKSTRLNSSH